MTPTARPASGRASSRWPTGSSWRATRSGTSTSASCSGATAPSSSTPARATRRAPGARRRRRLGRDIDVRTSSTPTSTSTTRSATRAFDTRHDARPRQRRPHHRSRRRAHQGALPGRPRSRPGATATPRDDAADVLATTVRGPDRTFGSNATIDLGDRVVTMTYAGRGHTDGDIAVSCPTPTRCSSATSSRRARPRRSVTTAGRSSGPTPSRSHLCRSAERSVVVPGHGHARRPALRRAPARRHRGGGGGDPRAPRLAGRSLRGGAARAGRPAAATRSTRSRDRDPPRLGPVRRPAP